MRSSLPAPPGFSFRQTLFSHGWCTLAPFRVDPGTSRLAGVLTLEGGGAARYVLSCADDGRIVVDSPGAVDADTRRQLRSCARRVLNLDLDLSEFYERARKTNGLGWIVEAGGGRLLRAPTLWEDLVKLVLTTNCSWALTTRMVRGLVEHYGARTPDGARAFPGPEVVAGAGERALRERVRAGYRAPLLARLARAVAQGKVDPMNWESDPRDPEQLRREMLELPGVGPYVAENMLKMLGRPAGLALDSWLRAKYARVYHGGRRVTDRTIARRYARLGPWAGLALWCEMTRDWLDSEEPSEAWAELE